MTKTANRLRRLTPATALIDAQSSVPYQNRRVVKGHELGIPGAQSGEEFLLQFVRQRGAAVPPEA